MTVDQPLPDTLVESTSPDPFPTRHVCGFDGCTYSAEEHHRLMHGYARYANKGV